MSAEVPDFLQQTWLQKRKLRDKRYQAVPLQAALRDRITAIQNRGRSQVALDANGLLHTLDWALTQPELVPPDLLAEYISELTLLMENVGAGLDFRVAIDRAVDYYQTTNQSTIDLLLSKVEYLRLTDTESAEKERALQAAQRAAHNPTETIKVLLKLIQYYIDTSQYRLSRKICEQAATFIDDHPEVQRYTAKVSDLLGITYYYRFEYKIARQHLERACQVGAHAGDEHTVGEALHYLGRIAMDEGDFVQAMQNLIDGNQHQPDNLADTAWYHLRMGDLLVKSGLASEARDHLMRSQEIFGQIQYNGSALVQIELAWADLYKLKREFKTAEQHILAAIAFAQSTHFFRGELLCLVSLFWLQLIRLRRIDKALPTFFRGITHAEIRRNEGIKLIASYLRKVLVIPYKRLKRQRYSLAGTATLNTRVQACVCPLHQSRANET